MNVSRRLSGLAVAAGLMLAVPASAQELITNGNFESGALAPWVVTDFAGSDGTFGLDAPGTTSPISIGPTAPNAIGGSFYVVSDQDDPGSTTIRQTFTVPAPSTVTLQFDMFVNTNSPVVVGAGGLDLTAPGTNQHARVDILSSSATAFTTTTGVLANLYLGADAGTVPNPYTHYTVDITPYVGSGGTYQIRFAEIDTQSFLLMGIDNVSITYAAAVPTMQPWMLGLLGIMLLFFATRAISRAQTLRL